MQRNPSATTNGNCAQFATNLDNHYAILPKEISGAAARDNINKGLIKMFCLPVASYVVSNREKFSLLTVVKEIYYIYFSLYTSLRKEFYFLLLHNRCGSPQYPAG